MVIPKILKEASILSIVKNTPVPPELYFSNKFPSANYPDQLLRWMIHHGDAGMAPITDRGVQAPSYKGGGISEMFAKGALINEKVRHTEEDLNALLTKDPMRRQAAEVVMIENVQELIMRNRLRKEWMASQIFFNSGVLTYLDKNGMNFEIDYRIPAVHKVTDLGANKEWGTGSDREPLKDIYDMRKNVSENSGSPVTSVFINADTMQTRLVRDTSIQAWLQKNAHNYTNQSLFVNPEKVLSEHFQMQFVVYDQKLPMTVNITQLGAGGALDHLYVDDASILKLNSTCWIYTGNDKKAEQGEYAKIASVDTATNKVTFDNNLSRTYIPTQDLIQVSVPFLPDDRVVFAAENVKGSPTIKWYNSPVGMGASRYGLTPKTWVTEDPDAVMTRVQNLGLWTLRHSKAIGTLDVG